MSKSYYSLGLMSGTSMDGVDASIIQSDGETKYKVIMDKYYEYPYYHTSLDNLDFVKPEQIEKSMMIHLQVLDKLDLEPVYKSNYPNGEVMLAKHDLYPKTGGGQLPEIKGVSDLDIILWLLWMCDGRTGLISIANKLNLKLEDLEPIVKKLNEKGLLDRLI